MPGESAELKNSEPVSILTDTLSFDLKKICEERIKHIIISLSDKLEHEAEIKKKDIIDLWNSISPEYRIGDVPPGQCAFKCEETGEKCSNIASKRSMGGYCAAHSKDHDDPPNKCSHIYKSGVNAGNTCDGNVSTKCKLKKYCSKHSNVKPTPKPKSLPKKK